MEQLRQLVWEPRYTVHVEELDAQHQRLFNITNDILALSESGSDELYASLQALVDYLCTHIRAENVVMIESHYPGYAQQSAQHTQFIDKMLHFLNSYKEDQQNLSHEIVSYLHHWIFSHTTNLDLKYGEHLLRTRAAQQP